MKYYSKAIRRLCTSSIAAAVLGTYWWLKEGREWPVPAVESALKWVDLEAVAEIGIVFLIIALVFYYLSKTLKGRNAEGAESGAKQALDDIGTLMSFAGPSVFVCGGLLASSELLAAVGFGLMVVAVVLMHCSEQ